MAKGGEKIGGRNLALTIIIGIFIAIMIVTLANLIVSYAYVEPDYMKVCNNTDYYPKPYLDQKINATCAFNKTLDAEVTSCIAGRGNPVYEYSDNGCTMGLKMCDKCNLKFEDMMKGYNRNAFFIFAIIGFLFIVWGLFDRRLLIQIIALPAGAILVIESAIRNFNDKLAVIIVLALLVIAAIYLALKKLR